MHGVINIGMGKGKDGMGSGIIWTALIWLHSSKSMSVCVLTIPSLNIIYLLIMVRKGTYDLSLVKEKHVWIVNFIQRGNTL